MASDRPSSDIVSSLNPNISTAMNEASTETGSARPVMTVERHELRNRNTVKTVSTAPSMSADWTLSTDASTREPASRISFSSTPGGNVFWTSRIFSMTPALTVVVEELVVFLISMPTALLLL